jgi:hypothetical protein
MTKKKREKTEWNEKKTELNEKKTELNEKKKEWNEKNSMNKRLCLGIQIQNYQAAKEAATAASHDEQQARER